MVGFVWLCQHLSVCVPRAVGTAAMGQVRALIPLQRWKVPTGVKTPRCPRFTAGPHPLLHTLQPSTLSLPVVLVFNLLTMCLAKLFRSHRLKD